MNRTKRFRHAMRTSVLEAIKDTGFTFIPTKRKGSGHELQTMYYPFGIGFRARGRERDIVEIQADKYDPCSVQVWFYTVEDAPLYIQEDTQEVDAFCIARPPLRHQLCASRLGRHFFRTPRNNAAKNDDQSLSFVAIKLTSLVGQIDDLILRGQRGPNVRTVGGKARDSYTRTAMCLRAAIVGLFVGVTYSLMND